MSLLQWRRFTFFDKDIVKPNNSDFSKNLMAINWSSHCSGFGYLIIGDTLGNIHIFNKHLESTSFVAYGERVTLLYHLKQNNIFVSIGYDANEPDALIKVWNMDKMDDNGAPTLCRIMKASTAIASRATCVSVHQNMNLIAVGYHNGLVVLFTGDVLRENRHNKQRILYESTHRITGLFFQPQLKSLILFIVTEGEVLRVILLPKDQDQQLLLANHGAALDCSVMSDASQNYQLVLARNDAIYFYESEGRGPCLVFEGGKSRIYWYRTYMIVVSKEDKSIKRDSGTEKNIITVYDIENKFIAYLGPISQIFAIFSEWGSLYILTPDKKLNQLIEKDTQSKLNLLFKKNMYMLAISLAKQLHYDKEGISEIHKQYADYLYAKGDFDAAIVQYVRTIGKLEPSYVIRKHLDTARIYNLTTYLQALHEQQQASEDHTTLLLNCYAKLKDETMLNKFIMKEHLDFDVETTMKVCRSAGFHKQALELAFKHEKHAAYLRIMIEDLHSYEDALKYITRLKRPEAVKNIKKYGKILMDHLPDETTNFLKKLSICDDDDDEDVDYDEFLNIFIDKWKHLMEFLEHIIQTKTPRQEEEKHFLKIFNSLLEVYLRDWMHSVSEDEKNVKKEKILRLLKRENANYDTNVTLIMCQSHNFEEGTLFLQEKMKAYNLMLTFHMEKNDYDKVLETCQLYGSLSTNLWITALSYFALQSQNCMPQILSIIDHIEKNHLFSPLFVIQTLAKSPTITLEAVKGYIVRFLQKEFEEISENNKIVDQLKMDTELLEKKIIENETKPKEFQNQKCNICNHSLDLPTVHFLCLHSFHQNCYDSYSENDVDCPICFSDYKKLADLSGVTELTKEFHDQFELKLHDSDDVFSVIAEYFGKNLFQKSSESKPIK